MSTRKFRKCLSLLYDMSFCGFSKKTWVFYNRLSIKHL